MASSLQQKVFGTVQGKPVFLYKLTNKKGIALEITNYGCIVTSLRTPDRKGAFADIVLGFSTLEAYLAGHPYFGCAIGRYANRIANGAFSLDGKAYSLAKNNGPNNLHGGEKGFHKQVWTVHETGLDDSPGLELTHVSADGEEGFPGTLSAVVSYRLTDNNEFKIDYRATTDKPTICNLTHHSYFNLAGEGKGTILGAVVKINADRYTPVSSTLIPTGELADVSGTPLDFRTATPIGARIGDDFEQLKIAGGYDHNWVLNRPAKAEGPVLAATAYEPDNGRFMEVYTTEPGLQLYTGNFLDGTLTGKAGEQYVHRSGFCLETQHYPDSPNRPEFPSVVLRPGATYRSSTLYRFSVK